MRIILSDGSPALEFPDEEQYWMMARGLWDGEGLKDEIGFRATRMPLYPAALALFTAMPRGVVAARALQWLVGSLAAVLTGAAAAALFNRRIGILAGFLAAVDPFLTFFSSLLLTETPFMTALVALWWVLWPLTGRDQVRGRWPRWMAVGLLSAVCVYLRESSIGLVLIAVGFVITCRRFERKAIMGAALALGLVTATLVPWAARNHAVTGHWCWLTHRAGISLYDGVGPQATGASDLAEVKQSEAVRGFNEVEWNRHFLNEAVASIKAHPQRVLKLAGVKLKRMWNPIPNVETYRSRVVRGLSALWTVPTFALAAIGVTLLSIGTQPGGWRRAMFLLMPAMYFSAVHALFVGSVRYRLPAIPMIEILVAVTLGAVLQRIQLHGNKHVA